ncbi:tRNA lysidine(34) synthetase TilS [Nakamurella endophytica]|uniref:tRNA lysidine(34) synthetase TilS n=1 Tax=Nakamurella endophytica TaxID=1748367 RepID=UPI001E402ABB|nr:tRNA lysidine(34) synthetase TilS [Nakamurella endophytica]
MAGTLAGHVAADRPVLVACSGGADSLALAVAVLAVAGPERASAVTVDHGLQPGSADRAAATAAQLAGLGYRRVLVRAVTVSGGGGPEAAARSARYRALAGAAAEVTAPDGPPAAVLLGHTLDDQAETVLLGLARGSGPRSVAGMREWREPFGRPLLAVRRAQTEAACRAAGLAWWEDPHNGDPRYTRVRLRREVLPLLEDVLHGGAAEALARTADQLADDLAALDELAAEAARRCGDGAGGLSRAPLRALPTAVRRRVLRTWVAAAGAGPLTADHLARLDRQVRSGRPGAAVRLPGGSDAVLSADRLWCRPAGAPAGPDGRLGHGGSPVVDQAAGAGVATPGEASAVPPERGT